MIQKNEIRVKLRNRKTPAVSVEKVPVLIPKEKYDELKTEGAYEFVESIVVPAEGTGGIYTKDYFQSFLDYMNEYPIGGSKDGHESQSFDFYTIGGELQMTSENEGVCNLRIIVPLEGWNSSNAALISALKMGVPELSIVADVDPVRGNDGQVYFMKEKGRPRNDIVPEGAMDVTVNSIDEKEIMALINKGAIDMSSDSTELVKNGKVFRKYAVALQSTSDKALAGRVLNAISEFKRRTQKTIIRRSGMKRYFNEEGAEISLSYEDVVAWIKNAIANNNLTTEQLVADIGMQNKLRTKNDDELVELKEDLCEALDLPAESPVSEVVEALEEALEELKTLDETVVDVAANELAGGKTIQENGKDVPNPIYVYAKKQLNGLKGKKLNSAKEALKDDPVMIALRSKQADPAHNVVVNDSYKQTIREV